MSEFKTQVLTIDGMQDDTCVRRITQALGNTPGVRVDVVQIGRAHVLAEPSCEPRLREVIQNAGYTLTRMQGED